MKTVKLALPIIMATALSAFAKQKKETMKELRTEIIIDAPAQEVWNILTEFESYPDWNPFIISIEGNIEKNSKLRAILQPPGMKATAIKPRVTESTEYKRFEWLGKAPLNFFVGRHFFEIEKLDNERVKFVQGEYFSGWLVKPVMKKVGSNTEEGFISMNRALKERAEAMVAEK